MKRLMFLGLIGLVVQGSAWAGETLEQLKSRQEAELQKVSDSYRTQSKVLNDQYQAAYSKFLSGKGKFPSDISRKISDVEIQRSAEEAAVRDRQYNEKEAYFESLRAGASDRSVASTKPAAGAKSEEVAGPAEPEVQIDGADVPKELQFKGKTKRRPEPNSAATQMK